MDPEGPRVEEEPRGELDTQLPERATTAEDRAASLALLRMLAGFIALFAVLSLGAWAFRAPLTSFGEGFVERFGMAGIFFGTFLADGFHFPVPPQFYLWTGLAAGQAQALVLGAVLVGSELGGLAAFALARRMGGSRFLEARISGPRRLLARYVERLGYLGLVVVALLPVSYCLLCIAAGAMRLPYRAYAVLAAMRVPRIVFSYAVIALAWGAS